MQQFDDVFCSSFLYLLVWTNARYCIFVHCGDNSSSSRQKHAMMHIAHTNLSTNKLINDAEANRWKKERKRTYTILSLKMVTNFSLLTFHTHKLREYVFVFDSFFLHFAFIPSMVALNLSHISLSLSLPMCLCA